MRKKELTLEGWQEIGRKTKKTRKDIYELFVLLNKYLPEERYYKQWEAVEKSFGKLRSNLDDIVCSKFPDKINREIIKIFYSQDDRR